MSPTSDPHHPTLTQCLHAARQVKAAPRGRTAMLTVRPRGVAAVIRARAPLTLILFVACIEGRLVWQGPQGFALLEPPLARQEIWRNRNWGMTGVLGWLDRNWSTVLFGLPAFLALGLAVTLLPFPTLHLAALLIVVATMVYVVAVLLIMMVWQLFFGRDDGPQALALSTAASDHWTMPLFHQEHEHRVDELFDQIRTRLHRLVADEVRGKANDLGGQVGPVRLSATLICVDAGVTTQEARLRLEAVRGVDFPDFSMRVFDARPEDLARRPARPPAFFRFYLFAVVITVLGIAFLVMATERGECADRCAEAPTSYGRALAWVAYQTVWREVPGVTAASDFAVMLGWLLPMLLPMVALVGIVAFRAQAQAVKQEKRIIEKKGKRIMGRTRVLIVTVTDGERDAVLDAIEGHTGIAVEPRFDGPVPVYAMGAVNDTELFVVQAGAQGITNPAGALTVTADAIRHHAPHYALIVGVCYGLRPDYQQIGDILVSEKIRDLDHAQLVELEGEVREVLRGETVVPSAIVLSSVRAVQRGWARRSKVPVHFGLMLAWNKLLDAEPVVWRLITEHPDAIGGDMEGAAFQAAARFAGVECLLIKSICDWGKEKTRDRQPEAAGNAARFVLHLVLAGALSRRPTERRGTP